ncbi:hypothetical protein D9M68_981900 [compost metagenome]
MEGREREGVAERQVEEVEGAEFLPDLCHGLELSEDPGDQLEGRDIGLVRGLGLVVGVPGKGEAGHAEALLVGCVIVERITLGNGRHADDGVVFFKRRHFAEF